MNYKGLLEKMMAVLEGFQTVLIYIKGSPDPDAIASSFAVKKLCDRLGVKSDIVASQGPSLPQNKAMLKKFGIPVKYEKKPEKLQHYDAYVIVDYQSARVKGLPFKMKCALHIDHHEEIQEDVEVALKITNKKAGSTSTIMALAFQDSGTVGLGEIMGAIATPLVFGIRTDTDNYLHAGDDDFRAMTFLSKYADQKAINEISGIAFSEDTLAILEKAMKNRTIFKDWLITGVGFIDEKERDSIAVIADFLLNAEAIKTAVVYAVVERNGGKNLVLDASLRTRDKDLDLDFFIKQITQEGGGRRFKGAFQVDLDYFINSPDMDLLWDLVNRTTLNVIMVKRSEIHFIELKGFYYRMKKKLGSFFYRMVPALILASLVAWGGTACGRKYGMGRAVRPEAKAEVEILSKHGCALMRFRDFDIAVQEIGTEDWKKILEFETFRSKKNVSQTRLPRLLFFHVVVANVGKKPVSLGDIMLMFGETVKKPLSVAEAEERCKSPVYAAIDYKRLLGVRRYLGEAWCFREINYEHEVIDYHFTAIAPGDSIIRIVAFDWVPVQEREMQLLSMIKVENGEEKAARFHFKRLEFRTKGKYFVNTHKTEK